MLLNFSGKPNMVLWVRAGHPFTIRSLQTTYPKLWEDLCSRKTQQVTLNSLVYYKVGAKTVCLTAFEFERKQELEHDILSLFYAKVCMLK